MNVYVTVYLTKNLDQMLLNKYLKMGLKSQYNTSH